MNVKKVSCRVLIVAKKISWNRCRTNCASPQTRLACATVYEKKKVRMICKICRTWSSTKDYERESPETPTYQFVQSNAFSFIQPRGICQHSQLCLVFFSSDFYTLSHSGESYMYIQWHILYVHPSVPYLQSYTSVTYVTYEIHVIYNQITEIYIWVIDISQRSGELFKVSFHGRNTKSLATTQSTFQPNIELLTINIFQFKYWKLEKSASDICHENFLSIHTKN